MSARRGKINFVDAAQIKNFRQRRACDLISRRKVRAALELLSDVNIRDKCLVNDAVQYVPIPLYDHTVHTYTFDFSLFNEMCFRKKNFPLAITQMFEIEFACVCVSLINFLCYNVFTFFYTFFINSSFLYIILIYWEGIASLDCCVRT